jgi:hypothetical protein
MRNMFVSRKELTFMRATAINCIPASNSNYHRLQEFLEDFVQMDTKFAKVEFGNEYASTKSAVNCLQVAAVRGRFPVKVTQRKDEIYLVRTDM